jgi:hypothetical protein
MDGGFKQIPEAFRFFTLNPRSSAQTTICHDRNPIRTTNPSLPLIDLKKQLLFPGW